MPGKNSSCAPFSPCGRRCPKGGRGVREALLLLLRLPARGILEMWMGRRHSSSLASPSPLPPRRRVDLSHKGRGGHEGLSCRAKIAALPLSLLPLWEKVPEEPAPYLIRGRKRGGRSGKQFSRLRQATGDIERGSKADHSPPPAPPAPSPAALARRPLPRGERWS